MLMCLGSELRCGWLQCSCYTEHGRKGLSSLVPNPSPKRRRVGLETWLGSALPVSRNCEVHEQCWISASIWYICCMEFELLLLSMADVGRLLCVRLWSEQSLVPCSFNVYK